ncbi:hypothetical protein SAMN06296036_14212 [Pseudobacteriovorax antillogorgiicola]|uniref:Uncharacterized protein n=1 Tax=Pseudobacteriovorax antillogorgiicola TaxID=1513793 RepID=A0A1Y6CRA1_9BACT|nr:hypothetical protein EDD56_14212 [Pseudobacteriovorax antillogorgiicola]SMF82563.1 hypothetical protein SAMN06296036_14212 [Pseudobacteriovorax antillogorgiicola]
MSDSQPPKNVINIGDRRHKAKKARPQRETLGRKSKPSHQNKISWAHYAQLILFLLLIAYLMEQCR